MAITLQQYKDLTGLTGTAKDAQITALIPVIVADFTAFCNVAPPDGSILVQAQMISYLLATLGGAGNKSESIEGYSYTKEETGTSGYPASIEGGLEKYVVMTPKYAQKLTQFRDRRELTLEQLANGAFAYGAAGEPIE